MSRRNKPDVWEVFAKVSIKVKKLKKENKKIIYDDAGHPVMEEVTIIKAKCKNCTKSMCRNADTLAAHYNGCIGKVTFDSKGYYFESKSSTKKRKFAAISPNDKSKSSAKKTKNK